MKIIVGLGNYGDSYAYTFHNMGFLTVECFAERKGVTINKRACDALICETHIGGEKVIIAQPLTYMNLSGVAVQKLLAYYKADLKDLIVVYDDIDIDRFSIRVRQKGSAGTHNGMRSIINTVKSEDFARVRIGIGRPNERVPLADYVLSTIPVKDRKQFVETFEKACDELEKFVQNKLF